MALCPTRRTCHHLDLLRGGGAEEVQDELELVHIVLTWGNVHARIRASRVCTGVYYMDVCVRARVRAWGVCVDQVRAELSVHMQSAPTVLTWKQRCPVQHFGEYTAQ